MVERYHAVSRFVLSHPGPYCGDYSGGLVAIDARGLEEVVLDLFQIRVANTARFHTNQDFAWADRRRGNLLHRDHTLSAVHGSVHGYWYSGPVKIGSRQRIPLGFSRLGHSFDAAGSVPATGHPVGATSV